MWLVIAVLALKSSQAAWIRLFYGVLVLALTAVIWARDGVERLSGCTPDRSFAIFGTARGLNISAARTRATRLRY